MNQPRVYALEGLVPVIAPSAFVHPSAVLIGDVIVGASCYIGPCASLRGDFGRLVLQAGVNVQDNCVVHTRPGYDTLIEEDGHIGHGAVIHCCAIRRNALVGMNAVIMDNAVIGESAVVAACAFVKDGMEVPPRMLAAGVPARIIRELSTQELDEKIDGTRIYHHLARRCLASMVATEPLAAAEADRPRMDVSQVIPPTQLKMGPKSPDRSA